MRTLTDFFSSEIPHIDAALHRELATLPPVLKPVAMHIAALPGKRLRPLVCLATAHPAKFPEVVEPLIGQEVPLPPALATMLERPSHAQPLADDAEALRDLLRKP